MALEMGKPVTQGRAEVQKCAWVCEYYADHAEKMLEPEIIQTDNRTKYHRINGKIFSTTVSWFGRHNEPITRMNPY